MSSIMLDLESLGTRPDCAILTLGAVKFDEYTPGSIGETLYHRIDVDEQLALGREVQEDTLAWWAQQAQGWPTPWQFWQIRDSRTLFGVHGDPREKGKAGLHNALEDCISQAQGVQEIYRRLKISKDR